ICGAEAAGVAAALAAFAGAAFAAGAGAIEFAGAAMELAGAGAGAGCRAGAALAAGAAAGAAVGAALDSAEVFLLLRVFLVPVVLAVAEVSEPAGVPSAAAAFLLFL